MTHEHQYSININIHINYDACLYYLNVQFIGIYLVSIVVLSHPDPTLRIIYDISKLFLEYNLKTHLINNLLLTNSHIYKLHIIIFCIFLVFNCNSVMRKINCTLPRSNLQQYQSFNH